MCVSDANIRNFQLVWPARIHFEVVFRRYRHYMYYETNRPTLGHIVPSFYQQDIIDWLRRITCFRRKSAKISARSLRSLAIIYVFFSSFCFSGRNKSLWTKPYHECYEHKDIIYCTDKPCDLSTEYWGESYVSDPKIPQISARSQYSFFISFWFSGRLKKNIYVSDAITQKCKNFGSLALLAHNH